MTDAPRGAQEFRRGVKDSRTRPLHRNPKGTVAQGLAAATGLLATICKFAPVFPEFADIDNAFSLPQY